MDLCLSDLGASAEDSWCSILRARRWRPRFKATGKLSDDHCLYVIELTIFSDTCCHDIIRPSGCWRRQWNTEQPDRLAWGSTQDGIGGLQTKGGGHRSQTQGTWRKTPGTSKTPSRHWHRPDRMRSLHALDALYYYYYDSNSSWFPKPLAYTFTGINVIHELCTVLRTLIEALYHCTLFFLTSHVKLFFLTVRLVFIVYYAVSMFKSVPNQV